jgi:hypothetical protein
MGVATIAGGGASEATAAEATTTATTAAAAAAAASCAKAAATAESAQSPAMKHGLAALQFLLLSQMKTHIDHPFSSGQVEYAAAEAVAEAAEAEAAEDAGGWSEGGTSSELPPLGSPIARVAEDAVAEAAAALTSRKRASLTSRESISGDPQQHSTHRGSLGGDQREWTYKCHTFWAGQFYAMRCALWPNDAADDYARSLGSAIAWDATGGKSGATFAKSLDGRLVVKSVTKTELQMFLDCAPAYFVYMSHVMFKSRGSVLVKVGRQFSSRARDRCEPCFEKARFAPCSKPFFTPALRSSG